MGDPGCEVELYAVILACSRRGGSLPAFQWEGVGWTLNFAEASARLRPKGEFSRLGPLSQANAVCFPFPGELRELHFQSDYWDT